MSTRALLLSLAVYVVLGWLFSRRHINALDNFYVGSSKTPIGATAQSIIETFLFTELPVRVVVCALVYYGVSNV
jgi:hypothetical protein